jgi:hypothetical protein
MENYDMTNQLPEEANTDPRNTENTTGVNDESAVPKEVENSEEFPGDMHPTSRAETSQEEQNGNDQCQ